MGPLSLTQTVKLSIKKNISSADINKLYSDEICCSTPTWTSYKSGPLKSPIVQEVHIAANISVLAVRNLFRNQLFLPHSVSAPKDNITMYCTPKAKGLK